MEKNKNIIDKDKLKNKTFAGNNLLSNNGRCNRYDDYDQAHLVKKKKNCTADEENKERLDNVKSAASELLENTQVVQTITSKRCKKPVQLSNSKPDEKLTSHNYNLNTAQIVISKEEITNNDNEYSDLEDGEIRDDCNTVTNKDQGITKIPKSYKQVLVENKKNCVTNEEKCILKKDNLKIVETKIEKNNLNKSIEESVNRAEIVITESKNTEESVAKKNLIKNALVLKRRKRQVQFSDS